MSTIPNAGLINPSINSRVFRVIIATVAVQLELSHPANLVLVRRFSLAFEKTYLLLVISIKCLIILAYIRLISLDLLGRVRQLPFVTPGCCKINDLNLTEDIIVNSLVKSVYFASREMV
jgi:hypothetical protein